MKRIQNEKSETRLASAVDAGSLNRREVLKWSTLGTIGLALGGSRAAFAADEELHSQIEELGDLVVGIQAQEPDLVGFSDMEQIAGHAFTDGLSVEDTDILAGALYLEALRQLEASQGSGVSSLTWSALPSQFSQDAVRDTLANPLPVNQFNEAYFAGLLTSTKERMAVDPQFADQVRDGAERAKARRGCDCTINGKEQPCWKCIVVIIVVIIIVL